VRKSLLAALVGFGTAVLVLGGTALATNTNFILGSTANAPDALTADTAQNKDGHGGLNGPMIQLTNSSTAAGATALGLTVGSGRPPFTTSSTVRVPKLNADRLGGVDSSSLIQGGGKLLSARVHLSADDLEHKVLDQSTSKPAFYIGFVCRSNPGAGGLVDFVNESSTIAEMLGTPPNGATSYYSGGKSSAMELFPVPAAGDDVEFDAWWQDGRSATFWVASYQLSGQADPTKDGCYVQLIGVAK